MQRLECLTCGRRQEVESQRDLERTLDGDVDRPFVALHRDADAVAGKGNDSLSAAFGRPVPPHGETPVRTLVARRERWVAGHRCAGLSKAVVDGDARKSRGEATDAAAQGGRTAAVDAERAPVDAGDIAEHVDDPALQWMIGRCVRLDRPTLGDAGAQEAGMLTRAVVEDRSRRAVGGEGPSLGTLAERHVRRAAKCRFVERALSEDRTDDRNVGVCPAVTRTGESEVLGRERGAAFLTDGCLYRLHRGAVVERAVGIAPRLLDVANGIDDDAAPRVRRLDETGADGGGVHVSREGVRRRR